ncbi:MAG: hypothetical protein KDD78_19025 [Caldilineaceae bacterium]|nr:hypothetical protein [Caldilineaceae bacterium]
MSKQQVPTKRYLTIALLSLALAASAGILLRFGLIMGMPAWAADYSAVRHAHSHLMYFGWVTLALMALIWRYLPMLTGRVLPRGVNLQMGASALTALLSFPAFWSNGYGTTEIGNMDLPLGSMVSGLNGILWIFFAFLYLQATWGLSQRSLPIQLWDSAILLLLVAFTGALGLVGMVMTGRGSLSLQQLFLHLFLDLFAVGWFGLALLGLLWAQIRERAPAPPWLPTLSLALCIAPTSLLGISPILVPERLFWIAAVANLIAAVMLAWHGAVLWQQRTHLPLMAQFGLAMLAIHAVGAIFVIWPGFWLWSAGTQLRVFYLHNFLLGWVSSALLGVIVALCWQPRRAVERTITIVWAGGIAVMLLALLGIGFIQYAPVRVVTLLRVAAWSSIVPTLVALWVLGVLLLVSCFQTGARGRQVTRNAYGVHYDQTN